MTEALTVQTWDKNKECVATVSEIMSALPNLKAAGAIKSFVVTDQFVRIELSTGTEQSKRWWHRKE
jgi:hypothetical protein